MAYHARKNIVTDGLVFSVDANNKLGGNVTDTKNLTNPTEVGTFVNQASVVNGEFDFDGVDDYIQFGDLSVLGDFTWDVWLKTPTSLGGYQMILSSSQYYAYLSLDGAAFAYDTNSNSIFRFGSISTETVYNVTISRESNVAYCYVNGVFIDSTSDSVVLNGSNYTIGNWAFNNTSFYPGKIYNAKIYNKALTQAEITQNYEATKHRFE